MATIGVVPIVIAVPTVAVATQVAVIPLSIPDRFELAELVELSCSLQALTTGPFTVEVRRRNGVLLDSFTFNAAGVQTHDALSFIFEQPSGGLRIDVAGIGVGASNCYVTAWMGLFL